PRRRARTRERAGTPEVRRAVHAGARRCVPTAASGHGAHRDRSRTQRSSHVCPEADASIRTHPGPARSDGRHRHEDGCAAADQRMALKGKGSGDIDVLIMTATPIPRTLALTYYGDLDVVVLDEMPLGRGPIETRVVRDVAARTAAETLVRQEVAAGRQAFVVCAAIDEANRNQVKAAEAEAIRLRTGVFPDLRVELLHGRMRPKEREGVMDAFRNGSSDVLISTTVIEVGVDVPNATVMLVENAERFGLAQLHQLRGRIGRGPDASYCVLF